MGLDFYGVSITGQIRQYPAGKGAKEQIIPLWVGSAESVKGTKFSALAFLSQVNVVYKLGDNVELQVVLTPPYEDALQFLNSELVRYGVGRLEVVIGYTTGSGDTQRSTLPFSGFLQFPTVSISGQDITITLNAMGVGYQMNMVGGTEEFNFPADYTWAQAINETIQKYSDPGDNQFGLKAGDIYREIPLESRKDDPFFKPPESREVSGQPSNDADRVNQVISKGPKNDWWFVRETLENYKKDLIIHGNEILVINKSDYFRITGSYVQTKHFHLRGETDPDRNMYPILSFSTPTEGVWAHQGIKGLVMADLPADKGNKQKDPVKHESNAENTSHSAAEKSAIGKLTSLTSLAVDAVSKLLEGKAIFPGDPEKSRDRQKVDAHWTDGQMTAGIQGTFTTLGIPDIRPGEKVEVHGFEPFGSGALGASRALFNGSWGIIQVRHSVGIGGWETSFDAIKGTFDTLSDLQQKAERSRREPAAEEDIPDPKDSSRDTVDPVDAATGRPPGHGSGGGRLGRGSVE